MGNYVEFWWKLWQQSWTLAFPLHLARLCPSFLQGIKLSFGFWMRISRENVMQGSAPVNMKDHVYKELALNCVRVLALEPGGFGDPLKGMLVETNLLKLDVEYEALSYVWGRFYPACYLDVGGARLDITGSLDDALRHLRRTDEVRYIWADLVCINQADNKEKSNQVLLMKEVYKKASRVNIWLGLSGSNSNIGLEILSFLASAADFNPSPPWTRHPPELSLAGLNDIILRPYFRRIWVVQEVAVAKRLSVNVGRQSFEWTSTTAFRFLDRLKLAEISPMWEQTGLAAVDMTPLTELVELQVMNLRGMRLVISSLDVIHNMRKRKATDPRDMIYALINLGKDEPMFPVDYGISREVLYQRLFQHYESIYKVHWNIDGESGVSK